MLLTIFTLDFTSHPASIISSIIFGNGAVAAYMTAGSHPNATETGIFWPSSA